MPYWNGCCHIELMFCNHFTFKTLKVLIQQGRQTQISAGVDRAKYSTNVQIDKFKIEQVETD